MKEQTLIEKAKYIIDFYGQDTLATNFAKDVISIFTNPGVLTASEIFEKNIKKYFQYTLATNQEEITESFLNNRIKGLSFHFKLFENLEYLDIFINHVQYLVEAIMLKDDSFDFFVIQIKNKNIYLKRHCNNFRLKEIEKFLEKYPDLPNMTMTETEEFPSYMLAIRKETITEVN